MYIITQTKNGLPTFRVCFWLILGFCSVFTYNRIACGLHSFTHSLIQLFIHSFVHSFIHLFIHSWCPWATSFQVFVPHAHDPQRERRSHNPNQFDTRSWPNPLHSLAISKIHFQHLQISNTNIFKHFFFFLYYLHKFFKHTALNYCFRPFLWVLSFNYNCAKTKLAKEEGQI